jgi:hypothetical protein
VAAALTISTAVGEVGSAASRLYKRGGASSIIIEEEIEKRRTIRRELPQRHSRRWKAEGLH